MCRFVIYKSSVCQAKRLADVIKEPSHSIIRQSYGSAENRMETEFPDNLNGDGFGIGFYSTDDINDYKPCVFTSTQPAWNNRNLSHLAQKVCASLFFAHVRAASSGLGVNESNCHPFVNGVYLFMHNGGISDFLAIKRSLLMKMSDEAFQQIQGSTDSEFSFALYCSFLKTTKQRTTLIEMENAMLKTIKTIIETRHQIGKTDAATSSLNFAVSDGTNLVVTRYMESKNRPPATLYFSSGTSFEQDENGEYIMKQIDRRNECIIIASERITNVKEDWIAVPPNTMLSVSENGTVYLKPITWDV